MTRAAVDLGRAYRAVLHAARGVLDADTTPRSLRASAACCVRVAQETDCSWLSRELNELALELREEAARRESAAHQYPQRHTTRSAERDASSEDQPHTIADDSARSVDNP